MSADLATVQRASTLTHRPTYRELEAQLVDARKHLADVAACARDELADAEEAMIAAVVIAKLVAARCTALSRPHDPLAEARILGALMNGRATLRDVVWLEPADFLGAGHAALFAAILGALRQEAAIGVRVRPSARRDPARRASEAARVRRRRVENAVAFGGSFEAWCALDGLPRPGACPRRDVVRVEELARWRRGER